MVYVATVLFPSFLAGRSNLHTFIRVCVCVYIYSLPSGISLCTHSKHPTLVYINDIELVDNSNGDTLTDLNESQVNVLEDFLKLMIKCNNGYKAELISTTLKCSPRSSSNLLTSWQSHNVTLSTICYVGCAAYRTTYDHFMIQPPSHSRTHLICLCLVKCLQILTNLRIDYGLLAITSEIVPTSD